MPAGAIVVGKVHKTEHINIVSSGEAIVVTEDDQRMHIVAPYAFVSKPGCKKALYIIKDMVWTTCHVTEKTDLDQIEADIIAPSYADWLLEQDGVALIEEK
jgi:hypothetical protein